MVVGTNYTIVQLIALMLQESDNDAASILAQYIPVEKIDQVYSDLGVQKVSDYNSYNTDVKTYSGFFRVLYNASYLDRVSSNEVLQMLANSTFSNGLVAGVPSSVAVAHKFGERYTVSEQAPDQLHDCGIVYVPEKNYILCVMTRGSDYEKQANFIAAVSRTVYETIATPPVQ